MICEHQDTACEGEFGRLIQGGALDTVDGRNWFVAAMVNGVRIRGSRFYLEFLTGWTLRYCCKMLRTLDSER